jgi:hypothetical protein
MELHNVHTKFQENQSVDCMMISEAYFLSLKKYICCFLRDEWYKNTSQIDEWFSVFLNSVIYKINTYINVEREINQKNDKGTYWYHELNTILVLDALLWCRMFTALIFCRGWYPWLSRIPLFTSLIYQFPSWYVPVAWSRFPRRILRVHCTRRYLSVAHVLKLGESFPSRREVNLHFFLVNKAGFFSFGATALIWA